MNAELVDECSDLDNSHLILFCISLDPAGVSRHELLKKFPSTVIRERAPLIEFIGDSADIGLRHLQARHVEEN